MEEESMDVPASEDNGNVSAMELTESTPSQPQPEVAPEATPEVQPDVPSTVNEPAQPAEAPQAEPEVNLFELPDGRKVDGQTLAKEWKENFYPEFTRRSQELAQLKEPKTINPTEEKNPYADPEYIPKSYDEVISAAEQRVLDRLAREQQEAQQRQQAIETKVASDIEAIKTSDPSVNIDQLFNHAVKYGFQDLHAAHKNMKDMAELIKTTQKTTVQNVAKRSDPVSKSSQPTGVKPNPQNFDSARDYLNAIKGS